VAASEQVAQPGDVAALLDTLAALTRALSQADTAAVGVGMAGLVRWPEGIFVWGPHLPGRQIRVREALGEMLGMPVIVDNDANCAALAELRIGAATGVQDAVVLTFGTGIGAGIIAGGAVYRGRSFAGEAGHMTMLPGGDQCACGRRGCWETLVSGHRFDEAARRLAAIDPDGAVSRLAAGAAASGTHLTAAAAAGDKSSREALAAAGRWLGRGVANLVVLLDPELIVVGGAAVAAGEWLLGPARAELRQVLEGVEHRPPIRIEAAAAGPWAGAIGAGLLAGSVGMVLTPEKVPSSYPVSERGKRGAQRQEGGSSG
jgi:glucokinase